MKSALNRFALAVVVAGTFFSGNAFAACGNYSKSKVVPQSFNGLSALVLPASASASDDPIVGMWHVTFTAKGNEAGPPDGAPIDNAVVIWHADGTEIMNSNRPAQDGNFCLGVWEKTGRSKYVLNHMPWQGNDTENASAGIGNPQGGAQIIEKISLSPEGNNYSGTFTLDAYDTSGNNVAHIIGVLSATRVTVNTNVKDLL